MRKLKLIFWNVNGLNSTRKRQHVFHWLNKQNSNIICVQEAHIKKTEEKMLVKFLGEKFVSLIDKEKKGHRNINLKRT